MRKHRWLYALVLSSVFTVNVISQDIVKCPINNSECVKQHLHSAKSVEIISTETNGTELIESTSILLINTLSPNTDFLPIQSMFGKEVKSVQATADISVDRLKGIKTVPKNSIFKQIIQTCPHLRLSENLKKLAGTKGQCILNENITVTYLPEDIYWCDNRSTCKLGPFPPTLDERLQLIEEGLSTSFKCNGSLIDQIRSLCGIRE